MLPNSHPLATSESMEWATRIYQKLVRFVPDLLIIQQGIKFEVEGYFSPICLEVMVPSEGYRCIQLHHCWTDSNGDPISDPRIVIVIYPEREMAEALMYSDMFSFEEAYPVKGGPVDTKVHHTINNFLERWLDALLNDENIRRVIEA